MWLYRKDSWMARPRQGPRCAAYLARWPPAEDATRSATVFLPVAGSHWLLVPQGGLAPYGTCQQQHPPTPWWIWEGPGPAERRRRDHEGEERARHHVEPCTSRYRQ